MAFKIEIPNTIPTVEEFRKQAPIGISALGTPVYDDITFLAGSFITADGNKVVSYPDVTFNTAKVMVTQNKNIVTTKVAGLDNTIKEYISLDDYQITINGRFTELLNIFPTNKMFGFKELSRVPDNVEVLSKFLNEYFDIFNVVVMNFNTAPVIGSLNEVAVNITLLSDKNENLNTYVV